MSDDHISAFRRVPRTGVIYVTTEAMKEANPQMILERAQQGLDIRRRDYPRDRLDELVGRIIHEWPSLRKPTERPVVYGLQRGTA